MTLLILGLLLWAGGHLFKRLAPEPRARLGDAGKGLAALLILGGLMLMVLGYRGAATVPLWEPPAFLVHVNNLLMLLAFYLFAASALKSWAGTRMRHPQLSGVKTWAVAHLLVNGDLAAVVLFGGLLAWAVAEVIAINRAEPGWRAAGGAVSVGREAAALAAALAATAVTGWIHAWLGVWPFGG
jgi:uncharacterized membrane protein